MVIAEMQRRALMAMDLEPKVDRLLRSDWERERVEKMAYQEARRKAKVEARREAKAARAELVGEVEAFAKYKFTATTTDVHNGTEQPLGQVLEEEPYKGKTAVSRLPPRG